MSEEKQKKRSFKDRIKRLPNRLKNTYQLAIMRADTLAEVATYKLTLLNMYILVSSILVVFGCIVVLLIAFTPLRQYVPGYAEASTNKELIQLHQEIRDLERTMVAQKKYIDNFEAVLSGKVMSEEEAKSANPDLTDLDSLSEPIAPESDQLLRSDVAARAQSISYQTTTRLPYQEGPVSKLYYFPPVKGEVSLGFSPQRNHLGIDVLAPKNTPIKAVSDGYVFFSDWTLETGNTIGIQHPNNTISFYKHNSALLKKAGSFVKAGEAIAIIGNTGTLSDGPHLHFELWLDGKAIDPTKLIQF